MAKNKPVAAEAKPEAEAGKTEVVAEAQRAAEAGTAVESEAAAETQGAVEQPAVETAVEDKPAVETARDEKAITTGKPATAPVSTAKVRVKPLRYYLDSETGAHVGPDTKPYEVSKHRAIQLRQNGLVEYETPADEHAAVADQVKGNADRIAARDKQGEIAAKDKTTPLNNPPVKRNV